MSGRRTKPAVSMAEIRPDLERLRRRGFLRSALSLGTLTMLAGCDLSTHSGVDAALEAVLRFDDRVQAALFDRGRLAETYPASAINSPFRFNAYYAEWQVRPVPDNWVLNIGGLVFDRRPWTLQTLMALPQRGQITQHICIEGWSQVGQWSGVSLASSYAGSAPIYRSATSTSDASMATRPASTWRAHSSRRPFWPLILRKSH